MEVSYVHKHLPPNILWFLSQPHISIKWFLKDGTQKRYIKLLSREEPSHHFQHYSRQTAKLNCRGDVISHRSQERFAMQM